MRRTLTELGHMAAALALAALLAWLSAWSYPRAGPTIWWVAVGAMGAIAVLSAPSLARAWRADWTDKVENET